MLNFSSWCNTLSTHTVKMRKLLLLRHFSHNCRDFSTSLRLSLGTFYVFLLQLLQYVQINSSSFLYTTKVWSWTLHVVLTRREECPLDKRKRKQRKQRNRWHTKKDVTKQKLCLFCNTHPLIGGSVLLSLRSPKGGYYSITDDFGEKLLRACVDLFMCTDFK